MTRRIRPTRSIPLLAALALCGCESLFNDFSVIPPEEIPRTPAMVANPSRPGTRISQRIIPMNSLRFLALSGALPATQPATPVQ